MTHYLTKFMSRFVFLLCSSAQIPPSSSLCLWEGNCVTASPGHTGVGAGLLSTPLQMARPPITPVPGLLRGDRTGVSGLWG